MAYPRYRRKPRRSYAKSARKPRSRSGRRSSYTAKTRRYTKRRPMSKRSILNLTSKKKRDTMLSWSNTDTGGQVKGAGTGSYFTNGIRTGWTVYCPTARDLTNTSGNPNSVAEMPDRTATTCYMRGLAEHIRIETTTALPWLHRRICFTVRGNTPFHNIISGDNSPVNFNFNRAETTNGWVRTFIDLNFNNSPQTFAQQRALLFKGAEGIDWDDVLTAPVDTSRVTLFSDKTYRISSGNQSGVIRERKMWHPMNKNLTYADDESGDSMDTNIYSVTDKRGMGDYFIVDIFNPGAGGTVGDTLRMKSVSSLYWHEK